MKIVVRHSAARKRRRSGVFDSARLNQLNSSWTFTRARESAPPYGKWSSRLARWFDARVIRIFKTIIIFQQSFSDHVSAPACCCVRILAFAERTRALEVDCLRLLVIWQRCDHVKRAKRRCESGERFSPIVHTRWTLPLDQDVLVKRHEISDAGSEDFTQGNFSFKV